MPTLDTSGSVALISRGDRHHPAIVEAFNADSGPFIVPAPILGEISHILCARVGLAAVRQLLGDIIAGAFDLDGTEEDMPRVLALLERYEDGGVDLPDASVAACTERHGGRVLTTDRRHFEPLARGESGITLVPAQLPQRE